jgi:hypothetical protein
VKQRSCRCKAVETEDKRRYEDVPDLRLIAKCGAVSAAGILLALSISVPCSAGWERSTIDNRLPQDITALAAGDADNDGLKEVVIGGDGWGLRIYEGEKSRWDFERIVGRLRVKCLLIGDADNDGQNEVVCSTVDRKILLYEWEDPGWSVKTVERGSQSAVASISCGDADGDGRSELAAGLENGQILLYEFMGGAWIKVLVEPDPGRSVEATAIGDPDHDGSNELAAGTSDRCVAVYERVEGVWEKTMVDENATPGVTSMDIADCDCDGSAEIVVGTSGKKIYAYEWCGGSWVKEVIENNAGGCIPGVTVADVDGDGWNELIVVSGTKRRKGSRILIYEKAPTQWYREEVDLQATGEAKVLCVGDPDNDGKVELLTGIAGTNSVFICDDFSIRRVLREPETENIVLVWESEPGSAYHVYYSEMPYTGFKYATRVVAGGDSVEWMDDGTHIPIHPREVTARYYTVRKENPEAISNTVGKFTRTFSAEMHLTSLPLAPYSGWIQDLIGTQLTGAKGEAYADRVWKWEPTRNEFQFAWLVDGVGPEYDGRWWCTRPFGPSAMTLDFGEGFFVQSQNGEQDVTFVGALPAGVVRMKSIRPGFQMVGAPHAEPVLLDSTDLYESGATGAPSELAADRIWRWDEEELRYRRAWLVDFTGSEDDGTWWDSEIWGKATTPMIPGYGYWYQARGDEFFWTFLD